MSQELESVIIEEISQSPQKRLSFKRYMELVLYHPEYGYYSSGKVKIGSSGDFFTSPSLGADFGELLAEQIYQMWELMHHPQNFTILEMGAGTGVLAEDILKYIHNYKKDLFEALTYVIVEQSPGLISQQKCLLAQWCQADHKVVWKSWEEIPDNSLTCCCFSNELVDAFPVHKVVVEAGKLQEVYVSYNKINRFYEVSGELSTTQILEYFKLVNINLLSDGYAENYHTEVNLASLNWLKVLGEKIKKGYIITIDYGYQSQKYYHPQRIKGTLQCYYQQRYHDNPYVNIGEQDLTAHVDFTALEYQGKLIGLETLSLIQQGIFLMALGAGDRLSKLNTEVTNLSEMLKRRDALHQLINPAGLGGFWVLVQAKGISKHQREKIFLGLPFGLSHHKSQVSPYSIIPQENTKMSI